MKTDKITKLPIIENFLQRQKYINLEKKIIDLIDEIYQIELPEENKNIIDYLDKLNENIFVMRSKFDYNYLKNKMFY